MKKLLGKILCGLEIHDWDKTGTWVSDLIYPLCGKPYRIHYRWACRRCGRVSHGEVKEK